MGKPPRDPAPEPTKVGRPRLYESDAEKLTAFRQRQQSAGYLRREVLVTEEVADQLSRLAKQHGVSTGDAASAMLEYGLERYDREHASVLEESAAAPVLALAPAAEADYRSAPLARAVAAGSAAPPSKASSQAAGPVNPITQFFKRRKGDPG